MIAVQVRKSTVSLYLITKKAQVTQIRNFFKDVAN